MTDQDLSSPHAVSRAREIPVFRERSRQAPVSGKVLCADGDSDQTDLLQYALTRSGLTVFTANTAAQAEAVVLRDSPDLILLDVNLPDRPGLELSVHFRTVWQIPVLLVTAMRGEEYEIAAFESGVDGYITKPFTMRVLVQRVHALLRSAATSAQQRHSARSLHRLGTALYNSSYNELSGNGVSINLTPIEGNILQLLLHCEGQILSAERIMARVLRYDTESNVTVMKTHIRNLRIKLARVLGAIEVIRTVPGAGYTLQIPPPETEDRKQA